MIITTSSGSLYFTIFYTLAFLISFLLLLWEGYQRRIPIFSWVLLLIFSRICFILGTKIFTFTPGEWLQMIQHFTLFPTSEKILPGGILVGCIALLTGKYLLRIKQNILDPFAVIVPLSFGIQKIGCFLNGCCYGITTTLPWGVQYPENTLPHYHQFVSGLIGTNDALSQPVHPVQLYEMAGGFLVAFIVFSNRKRWKSNGSSFTFSVLLFCLFRFLTEFFRDIQAHATGGEMAGIFNQIQWAMLLAIVSLSIVLFYRERIVLPRMDVSFASSTIGIKPGLIVFTFEALLILALRHWFSTSELIAVLLTFFISGVIILIRILHEIVSSRTRIGYAILLILPFLITSQTIPANKEDSTLVLKSTRISFGMVTGNFENSIRQVTGTTETGCGTSDLYETSYFKQKYTVGGAAISFRDEFPQKKFATNYGMNLYLGQNREILLRKSGESSPPSSLESKTLLYGLNPYIKFDAKWLGFGGGLHVGNLRYPQNEEKNMKDITTSMVKTSVFPDIYLRIGPLKSFFVDYHFADQFAAPFPYLYQQIGIGTGLGLNNNTNLRLGGFIGPGDPYYISTCFPVNKLFSVEPMLVISGQSSTHFSFNIHYNLSSGRVYRKRQN